MNESEKKARELIHSAVFRIIRQAEPIPISEFFNKTIGEVMPTTPTPPGWENFWWESLAIEIQRLFILEGRYILDFDEKWLEDNKDKKWEELISYLASGKLVPFKKEKEEK
ncbi:hypothetical protein COY52_09120 [Candidatus Desantisbacteria bacterium CG_4_10_14_0_8_um_filter_48_22]|uniref:Uncharacterized protein n=1 Tax=Candidatus Desantisbacteria bacterium CG_4_10_14_0_8_um_filter_48_22 TaxID=1974543 RepID=A0A2M7S818_9BACT|nr:MAG: hypothetical protein AUJ67_00165 [Candidatus Desantisbacteria bacterium CG1_02_49_89]PIV56803.1 MAG: hypothetical protein COS16_02735 [Candidatus Desantisbacteria bacterium CG02_land_8_20_14_3_00_49_13]PIZ15682.1 MAG: hypothetical protein COY52_09120 [Candidatus Desantisbacteria bacterium CG_4_10_14_0_8_um_filter_48_22]